MNRYQFIPRVLCSASPGICSWRTFHGLENHYDCPKGKWSLWVEKGLIRYKRRYQGKSLKKGTQDNKWRNFLRICNYIQTLLWFLVSYGFLTAYDSFFWIYLSEKGKFVLGYCRTYIFCPLSHQSCGTESQREKLIISSSVEERIESRKFWKVRHKGKCRAPSSGCGRGGSLIVRKPKRLKVRIIPQPKSFCKDYMKLHKL